MTATLAPAIADWLGGIGLDLLGWGGSLLLVWSVLQARLLRFRVLNLAASAVLTVFNAVLGIWSMVAMNLALCAINLWHLRRLASERHDEQAFAVLEVRPDDTYLRHVLATHREDILAHQPDLDLGPGVPDDRLAFLVQHGDETVGVVLLRDRGPEALVELDWVSRRFRDFSPGEFVWRRSRMLRDHGFDRVRTSPRMVGAYYERIGFRREQDHWSLDLTPAG